MKLFEQILTEKRNPNKSGWYDTDKGQLFYWADKKEWSCRDDRVSEEYPKVWYSPYTISINFNGDKSTAEFREFKPIELKNLKNPS